MELFLKSCIRSALLFGTLAIISWLTGALFIWPSLGPTAYILAFDRDKEHPFTRVFGAHTLGAGAGLLAHHIFAPGLTIAMITGPLQTPGYKIALSAIIALSLTTGLMRSTGWTHSPACATTLIVALGLISRPIGVAYILAAVVLLYCIHFLTERFFEYIGWIKYK